MYPIHAAPAHSVLLELQKLQVSDNEPIELEFAVGMGGHSAVKLTVYASVLEYDGNTKQWTVRGLCRVVSHEQAVVVTYTPGSEEDFLPPVGTFQLRGSSRPRMPAVTSS